MTTSATVQHLPDLIPQGNDWLFIREILHFPEQYRTKRNMVDGIHTLTRVSVFAQVIALLNSLAINADSNFLTCIGWGDDHIHHLWEMSRVES